MKKKAKTKKSCAFAAGYAIEGLVRGVRFNQGK